MLENVNDKLKFDVAHIEQKYLEKDKEHGFLQAELFLKEGEWKKLEDQLRATRAIVKKMNHGKGVIDQYYQQVKDAGYGIGFDMSLDGIYQSDKIEGPKEFVPGIGNIEYIDPKKAVSDEETDYVGRLGKDVDPTVHKEKFFMKKTNVGQKKNVVTVGLDEEFLNGEKMYEEIICDQPPKDNGVDSVEEYINEFFKRGEPLKQNGKIQNVFMRMNQYRHHRSIP